MDRTHDHLPNQIHLNPDGRPCRSCWENSLTASEREARASLSDLPIPEMSSGFWPGEEGVMLQNLADAHFVLRGDGFALVPEAGGEDVEYTFDELKDLSAASRVMDL